jgi:hypothetical protein
MATKNRKIFNAVAESRRWRIPTSRKLRALSFEQQQALLRKTTEDVFVEKTGRSIATVFAAAAKKLLLTHDTLD